MFISSFSTRSIPLILIAGISIFSAAADDFDRKGAPMCDTQGFENGGIPALWSTRTVSGTTGWSDTQDGICGSGSAGPGNFASTGVAACVDSDADGGPVESYLCTPALDLLTSTVPSLSFLVNYQVFGAPDAGDFFQVLASTTAADGPYDPALYEATNDLPAGATSVENSGELVSVDLSAYNGEQDVWICFGYSGNFDWYAHVDDVQLTDVSVDDCAAFPVDLQSYSVD